jgi:gliding motility-associated protein GldL
MALLSKKTMNFAYGMGAAVVIVGALFKIQHWTGASLMLIIGLSVEALIFGLSAFDPVDNELDWSLVYPELAGGQAKDKDKKEDPKDAQGLLSQKLDAMLKEAREMKEKMVADAKNEAQAQGLKMIEQAKAAIEGEKNAALAELKSHVATLSLEIAEKVLKEELSNKESQVKLVEKMLGDAKLN